MRAAFIGILIAALIIMLLPAVVSAHVLVTGMNGGESRGAVIHIIPDDDPIAGEPASIYADIQELTATDSKPVRLTITGESGQDIVPMLVDGSLATAEYTFAYQGVYEVSISAQINDQTYVFMTSQRVSRGDVKSILDQPRHDWAIGLLVGSGAGFCLLGIVVVNRRKQIASQSTL